MCASRRHLENRPIAAATALNGRAIKISVAALHQCGGGPKTIEPGEIYQRGQCPAGCHLEYSAGAMTAAIGSRSIEIPVATEHQRGFWRASVCEIETHQSGEGATRSHLEYRAVANTIGVREGTALCRRAVKIPIVALDQTGSRIRRRNLKTIDRLEDRVSLSRIQLESERQSHENADPSAEI